MRRVHLALCAVLSATLGACTDNAPANDGMRGSITVAAAGGEGEIKALKDLVEAFEAKYTGLSVTVDSVEAAGDLVTKLTTSFAGNTPPDVFLINYRRMGGFVSQIEPVAGADTSDLYPAVTAAFSPGGTLLCLPQNASSLVIYLNPKLFAHAGVDLPKQDWSWASVLATAQALAAKKVEAVGFDPELIRLAPFVWSAGGEIVDSSTAPTKVTLDSPEARSAIQLFLALQETGLDATQRAAMSAEDTFAAGKVAMYLDSRRAVPGFRGTDGLDFDVRPLPNGARGRISVLHSDGYCVSKGAENKTAAQAFAAYAVSADGGKVLAESGRTVPSAKELAESPSFLAPDKKPASSRAWLDQIPTLRPLPVHANWNDAEGVSNEVLEQLFAGKLTVDRAITEIATLTGAEFAKT